jgi:hypothetical protein
MGDGEGVIVYRAVSADEGHDIAASNSFRLAPGQEGKYFYPTAAQAQYLVDKEWASTVIAADAPAPVLWMSFPFDDGSLGPAWFVPRPLLPFVRILPGK